MEQACSEESKAAGAIIVSIVLGVLAIAQIVVISGLLVFGRELPRVEQAVSRLSPFDWIAIFVLAAILVISMKMLFQKRKAAISWFLSYVGLSSWLLLFYSFSPRQEPHFDEVVSLPGLLVALSVLAYLFRLRLNGKLR